MGGKYVVERWTDLPWGGVEGWLHFSEHDWLISALWSAFKGIRHCKYQCMRVQING